MMNNFDRRLEELNKYPLRAEDIHTLQVNIGYRCNLACSHCHIEASPARQEMMSVNVMSQIIDILEDNHEIGTVDITGGSPELNPYFMYFINLSVSAGKKVMVRTNLTLYSEPNMTGLLAFYAEKGVKIIASLPCYTEDGVDRQRGKGTYQKAIRAMKELNALGYGRDGSNLELDIMFNPFGLG